MGQLNFAKSFYIIIEELNEVIFMSSNKNFSSVFKPETANNSNLYSFSTTNYDLTSLAKNIVATKSASLNLIRLKKSGNVTF